MSKAVRWRMAAYRRMDMYRCALPGSVEACVDCCYDDGGRLTSIIGSVRYVHRASGTSVSATPVVLSNNGDGQPDRLIAEAKARMLKMAKDWLTAMTDDMRSALTELNT